MLWLFITRTLLTFAIPDLIGAGVVNMIFVICVATDLIGVSVNP